MIFVYLLSIHSSICLSVHQPVHQPIHLLCPSAHQVIYIYIYSIIKRMFVNSISCVHRTHSNVSVTQTIAGRDVHGTRLIRPYIDCIINTLYKWIQSAFHYQQQVACINIYIRIYRNTAPGGRERESVCQTIFL